MTGHLLDRDRLFQAAANSLKFYPKTILRVTVMLRTIHFMIDRALH